MDAAEMLSLAGFLLIDQEWRDEHLRSELLTALAAQASAAGDAESYESYELVLEAHSS
jgi:hypothetical protein